MTNDKRESVDAGEGSEQSTADQIVESDRAEAPVQAIVLSDMLSQMGDTYRANPDSAVRSQGFIQSLHRYVGTQLNSRLTKFAVKRRIAVRYGKPEAQVLGSTKPKDVDVAVIDPESGPLVIIGIRSQMSSIGKNVLNYYEVCYEASWLTFR